MQELGLRAKCGQECPPDRGRGNPSLAGQSWLLCVHPTEGEIEAQRCGRAGPKRFPSPGLRQSAVAPPEGASCLRQEWDEGLEPLGVKAGLEPRPPTSPGQTRAWPPASLSE